MSELIAIWNIADKVEYRERPFSVSEKNNNRENKDIHEKQNLHSRGC